LLISGIAAAGAAQSAEDIFGDPFAYQYFDEEERLLLAQVDTDSAADTGQSNATNPDGADIPLSPECAAFAADKDAELGDVLHAGCKPTLAQMSALMDNPLGNVAMLFLQYDQYHVTRDDLNESENQSNFMTLLQFPKGLGKNWNLINRVVFNIASVPIDQDKIDAGAPTDPPACPPPPGGGPPTCNPEALLPVNLYPGRTTGLGDSYYVGLFSPKVPIDMGQGKFVWGAGFDALFPTASEDVLGVGKWAAGPSALGVYLGPRFKGGALWQQYFSFAGSDNRGDVNLTNLQYFYMWGLSDTLSIGAAPNIIINWEADGTDRFTIPVGLGLNKTVQFGKIPVRLGFEVYYSVWKPNNVASTEWNLRFYAIPAAPSALFGWMK
jgi:hypothetical protein